MPALFPDPAGAPLRVEVARSVADLRRHAAAYEAFAARLTQGGSLFYSLPWLEICTPVYVTPERGMYFLLAWQGDTLVGVAPLQLEQKSLTRGRVRRLFCWGNVHGSLMLEGRFLIPDAADIDRCIQAFAAHVLDPRSGAVDCFEFHYLDEQAPEFAAVQRHFRPQSAEPEEMPSYQMVLPATFEAYAETLGGSTLMKVRNRWRALQKAGRLEFLPVTRLSEAELAQVMQMHMGRQDLLRERGRTRQSLFQEPRLRDAHLRLLAQAADDGSARHYLLKVDGTLVCVGLGFHRGDTMIYHLTAFDPAWGRFEPGRVLWFLMLQAEIERGQTRLIDALPGITKVKQDFSNASRSYRCLAGTKPHSLRARVKVGTWRAGVAAAERLRGWRERHRGTAAVPLAAAAVTADAASPPPER
jgi:CelD/BcsL family acetyltransferase involved in cellulose biosynthesis